ncbi:MAG TPA: ammonium transporter [Vicinamibacterales bacterium]|jgi:ammonium transporter, Amt family|nr:ammonium transporter [Vicinamibacterales bacterium]
MNQADTAWMLISTALVLLMTPALAFFYGGLVRSKNALNTMMMSFISLGFVAVLWALVGYSLALSPGSNFIGDLSFAFLNNVGLSEKGAIVALTFPHMLYMAFQATFCIITAALISGAVVERMNFKAYLLFICAWSVVVYAPLAHWVWGGGFLADMGAWDFAGGTVVHVNAGVAALVAAMVVGKRTGYGSSAMLPHNVPTVLLGAGLLWFGWFGFNAGSAVAASPIAGLAFVTTMFAPAATLVVWTLLDLMRTGKPSAVGCATAIVVGLVAVTPAAGFVSPVNAMLLGAIAAVPSYFGLILRARTSLDDSLDVVAAHGLGGTVGALLTGVFADRAINGVFDGALYGNPAQLGIQAVAVGTAIVYSGVASFVLLKLIGLFMPLRATAADEMTGLDLTMHGEEAYVHVGDMEAVTPEPAGGGHRAPAPVPVR